VYERVSGRTIPVSEPLRLAALFERGDQARATGQTKARRAALGALVRGRDHDKNRDLFIQFGVGLAAAGYLPDISSRLFTEPFERTAIFIVENVLSHGPVPADGIYISRDVTQDARTITTFAPDMVLGQSWSLRVSWDGAVSIFWTQPVVQAYVQSVVDGPLRSAWDAAEQLLLMLAPQGSRHLGVAVAGGELFPPNTIAATPSGVGPQPVLAQRGPLAAGVADDVLASIARELRRAASDMAYEPAPPPG
jgi:hypothetical protein